MLLEFGEVGLETKPFCIRQEGFCEKHNIPCNNCPNVRFTSFQIPCNPEYVIAVTEAFNGLLYYKWAPNQDSETREEYGKRIKELEEFLYQF